MSIKEKATEIKGYATAALAPGGRAEGLPVAVILVMVALASYGLGYKSAEHTEALPQPVPLMMSATTYERGQKGNESASPASTTGETATSRVKDLTPLSDETKDTEKGMYVGSRKGTKYHLPWCAGAKTISEENKIWFVSKEDAEAKGYAPAQNCKGI